MSYQFFFSLLVEVNFFDSIFLAIQVVQGLHRNELCKIKIKTNHWCFTVFSTGKLILWYLYLLGSRFYLSVWAVTSKDQQFPSLFIQVEVQWQFSFLLMLEWSYWQKWGRWWLELCWLGTATLARLVKSDTWKLVNSCFVVVVFVSIAYSNVHTKSNNWTVAKYWQLSDLIYMNLGGFSVVFELFWWTHQMQH